jgi:CubicO group peptidase (beta-lactamase class C family)
MKAQFLHDGRRETLPTRREYGGEVIDHEAVDAACWAQSQRSTEGISDMESYLAEQVGDGSHRDVMGPLLAGGGASGVVLHRGQTVGGWGDPDRPEMLFSATKSFVSLVAGVAFDAGLLDPAQPVAEVVDLPEFADDGAREISWEHLLQQRSGWEGELWGKPSSADAQSQRDGPTALWSPPGTEWAYNDVRVQADVGRVAVVSGGAHWGGGLFMSARDLALVGELCRNSGTWNGTSVIDATWFERQWAPCPIKSDYGYLWWLNHDRTVFPGAPASGVCARGNGGRHLLWIDSERHLVIASHWGDDVQRLLAEVSAAVDLGDLSPRP